MRVIFGRPNGEKTLGEVVKINPKRIKIRTLEDRGQRSVEGSVWSAPAALLERAFGRETEFVPGCGGTGCPTGCACCA